MSYQPKRRRYEGVDPVEKPISNRSSSSVLIVTSLARALALAAFHEDETEARGVMHELRNEIELLCGQPTIVSTGVSRRQRIKA